VRQRRRVGLALEPEVEDPVLPAPLVAVGFEQRDRGALVLRQRLAAARVTGGSAGALRPAQQLRADPARAVRRQDVDERVALPEQHADGDELSAVAHTHRVALELHARPPAYGDEVLLAEHRLAVVVLLAGAPHARDLRCVGGGQRRGLESLHSPPLA
jgi:hypothetical protein